MPQQKAGHYKQPIEHRYFLYVSAWRAISYVRTNETQESIAETNAIAATGTNAQELYFNEETMCIWPWKNTCQMQMAAHTKETPEQCFVFNEI